MSDAANIQIKINTAEAEKAEKVLLALEERSDSLYRSLSDLDSGASFTKLNAAANDSTTSIGKLTTANDSASKSLDGVSGAAGRYVDANGKMRDASGKFSTSTGVATGAVGGLAAKLGSLTGIFAGGAFFTSMITKSREFEAAMNDVEEKLGGTTDQMKELRSVALEMGSSTAFSASQSADAMSSLAAKGLETHEIIKLLPDVLNLAAAAQLSLEGSAKLTTATMNQFGISVEESTRVVDLLASVGDSSGATIEGLEAALKKAGPAANAYGVSLESTAAVIAILADNSIEAEIAGTAMAGMFSKLMVATGDGSDAMAEIGLASSDFIKITADGKEQFVGYAEAIDLISDAGASATQVSRIFGLEAGKNLVPLVAAGGDAIRDMELAFGDASTAAEQAITQMKGLPGAWRNTASAWEGMQLALMGAGGTEFATQGLNVITALMRTATGVVNDVAESYGEFKEKLEIDDGPIFTALRNIGDGISSVGDALSPIAPFLTAFVGALATLSAGYAGYLLAATAITGIGTAIAFMGKAIMANPIALGVAAIAATVYVIYDNWDGITEWWSGIWEAMKKKADDFVTWFKDIPDRMISGITSKASQIKDSFFGLFDFLPSIADETNPIMEMVGVDTSDGLISGIWSRMSEIHSAAFGMGQAVESGVTTKLEVQSPSRLMMRIGGFVVEGLANGITGGLGLLQAVMADASREIERGISRSILDASSIRDAFGNLGDFMEDWLKEKVASFAAKQIMVSLGIADGGFTSGLSGILGNAGSIMSGFGSSVGASMGTITSGINKFLGGSTSFVGSMDAARGSAMGATETVTNFGGTLSTVLGRAGIIGTALTGIHALGEKFGEMTGLADTAGAGIGMLIGGPLGALLGGSLPSGWQTASSGVSVGVSDGEFQGENYEHLRARGGLSGTKNIHRYSELDAQVFDSVNGYFTNLNDTIVEQAGALGISGADSILDGFNMATQIFTGGTANEDLQEWLEDSTREAYRSAFDRLGPELQAIVSDNADLLKGPIEDTSAIFAELGGIATTIVPMLEGVGVSLSGSIQVATAEAYQLTEALGGSSAAISQLALFNSEFVPTADRANFALNAATAQLDGFNEAIVYGSGELSMTRDQVGEFSRAVSTSGGNLFEFGLVLDKNTNQYMVNKDALNAHIAALDLNTDAGRNASDMLLGLVSATDLTAGSAITTRDQLYQYVQAQDASTEAGIRNIASAMGQMEAIIAVENAAIAQTASLETLDVVMRDLNVAFDTATPSATATLDAINALDGGLEGFTAGAQAYMQSVYSEAELTAIELAKNASAVKLWNEQLGLNGASMIDTKDELRLFTESLGPLTAANAGAYQSVFDITGSIAALDGASVTTQQAIDQLPPHLQSAFSLMNDSAVDAGQVMGQASATMIIAADSINRSFGGVGVDANVLANAMATLSGGISSNAGQVYNSANTASASLSGVAGTLGGLSSTANTAANNIQSAVNRIGYIANSNATRDAAAMQIMTTQGVTFDQAISIYRDGSYATGLDYVPRDGWMAETHKGEMITTASVSDQLRAMGVTATSIPANLGSESNLPPVTASPVVRQTTSDNGAMVSELAAIRRELAEIKRENAAAASATQQGQVVSIQAARQQSAILEEQRRDSDRLSKKIAGMAK